MNEEIDELLCGDDVDRVYGDDWYFKMAKEHLSEPALPTNMETSTSLYTPTLKDAS